MSRFLLPETPNDNNAKVLIELRDHLEDLNGDISTKLVNTRSVGIALTKLDEAWLWLCKAAQ